MSLTRQYPKLYPIVLSDKDKLSFDVNDEEQVCIFINDAIEKIIKEPLNSISKREQLKATRVIESMLEEGINLWQRDDGVDYRSFVMEYVTTNYDDRLEKMNSFANAFNEKYVA
jgi:hypothetical protein